MKTRICVLLLGLATALPGCTQKTVPTPPRQVATVPETPQKEQPTTPKVSEPTKPSAKVQEKPKPPENPLVSVTEEPGVLKGRVTWTGTAPKPLATAEECHVLIKGVKTAVPPPVLLRVGPDGGVAGAMVWLAKAPESAAAAVPGAARLIQRQGEYLPPVQFVAPETALRLQTADDAADFNGSGRLRFTRSLERGKASQVRLPKTGLTTIRSHDRPWMAAAHVRVLDHEFHAITAADGTFTLPRVPPGEYELRLWHPGWRSVSSGSDYLLAVEARAKAKIAEKSGAAVAWVLSAEPQ